MSKRRVALVTGDGSAPGMMAEAVRVVSRAAVMLDGLEIEWVETPMGWNAYKTYGDTTPASSLELAQEIGLVFFGGVGDPAMDSTVGKEHPEMMPEGRALLKLRKSMGLLLNFRPMKLMKALAHLSPLKPELIPDGGVEAVFIRFLLQDSYFGTTDLSSYIDAETREKLGLKLKADVTGMEEMVTELAYYRRETVVQYFHAAFKYARERSLPLIVVDKSNVMPRYVFWRKIAQVVARMYPDVPVRYQLVDSACMKLFHPQELNGVIACGNEHGDIVSDGAAEMVGGLGMMHSSSVNPETAQAMFESGAGTAPTLAGQNKANPLGRIMTGAMLLEHIDCSKGGAAIRKAVRDLLVEGYRTGDIAEPGCTKILSCSGMGDEVLKRL